MKWEFKEISEQEELYISLSKSQYDTEVESIIHYLEQLTASKTDLVPLKVDDRIMFLKPKELIAIEMEGQQLSIRTINGDYTVRERLYRMKDRLNGDFVQVSKQSLLNIKHLKSMEASFSGNMLAILSRNIKVVVSRRYLKALEAKVGL